MKQILSALLGILIVFTSMGFSLSKHYCQGQLKSTALFVKAKSCHKAEKASCHKHMGDGFSQKSCCENDVEYIKGIDLETSIFAKTFTADVYISFDPKVNFFAKPVFKKELLRFSNFHPPPIVKDIIIFVQSFLL